MQRTNCVLRIQSMDDFDRGIRYIFGQVLYFVLFYTW